MTGLIHFSVDAASNDRGAPPINFEEGQAANTVNNSARETLAALARWRDDNAGVGQATRGAGNAYSLSTVQGFAQAQADAAHTIAFTVATANTGPATLSLDGRTPRNLWRPYERALAPGDLTPRVLYVAVYIPALTAYVLVAPALARPGTIVMQGDGFADPGWLACDGQAVSRTAYAALFAAIGTAFGAGDGTATFNVPNLNGRAPFGPGLTGAGGIAGTIGSSGGTETVTLTAQQMPSHNHPGSVAAGGGHNHGGAVTADGNHNHGGATGAAGQHGHNSSTNTVGGHTHTGTTNAAGQHAHAIQYYREDTSTGSGKVNTTYVGDATLRNSTGTTESVGNHVHTFSTESSGEHAHTVSIQAAPDHTHGIPDSGTHAHGIPGAPDHSHGLSIEAAGGGAAHGNMPPGLVVAFLIKA